MKAPIYLSILALLLSGFFIGRGYQAREDAAFLDTYSQYMRGEVGRLVIENHELLRALDLPAAMPSPTPQGTPVVIVGGLEL